MTRPSRPNTAIAIALYTLGIALIIAAALIILHGMGILEKVPQYVFGGLALLTLGGGILGGLQNSSR